MTFNRVDVLDTRTGLIVRSYPYAKRAAARRLRDRLDAAHGACRYTIRLA